MPILTRAVSALVLAALLTGCATRAMPVQRQEYAELKDSRTFEHEFPVVWKGIERVFAKHKVTDRDPAKVNEVELRSLAARTLRTDWIIGQSRDKYVEFKVNDSPRRKLLQVRFRYTVEAKRSMGGADVRVRMDEEIERVRPDGSPAGWDRAERVDSSRVSEVLDQIQQAILSAAP